MPIKDVDLGVETNVEFVSVLDHKGNLDPDLEPEIPDEDLRELYRTMIRVRTFDERRLKLQRQGRIGTFAPVQGQEAAQLGSIYALQDTDWFVPSFRETAAATWRGFPFENDLIYAAGYEEAMDVMDEDSRDMPIAIPVASQICHGAGIAWARKLKGTDEVCLTYFGDGATSEGDFHEGVNFAGVFDAPCIFLCQNNQWAISVPRSQQTKAETIAQKGIGYGVPGVQVDGNDILAVYKVTKEAVERARRGEGPTLIEAITYRMNVHTTADDPTKYRDEEEVEPWRERDPIDRFERYLKDKGLLDDDTIETWKDEAVDEVQEAVDAFESRAEELGDPAAMFDHHLDEMPDYLVKQKEELVAYWEANDVWGDHHG